MKKKKLILTKGLIASGKTTWANEEVKKSQGSTININKDDLRAMLDADIHSSGREKFVLRVQEAITDMALREGKNVIWSDTNLNPIHFTRAEKFSNLADVVTQDFTHVGLKTCIERDRNRAKPIGEKAIRSMYNQYLKKEDPILEQDENLPDAIAVDIDGTLAHMVGRSPFDWMRVGEDRVDNTIAEIVRNYYELGYTILIVSGRDAICRELTKEWLAKHNIPYRNLLMRPEGDQRKDSIVKEEIFREKILGKFNLKFVLDDRQQVVDMWRSLGIKVLQVAPGDF